MKGATWILSYLKLTLDSGILFHKIGNMILEVL